MKKIRRQNVFYCATYFENFIKERIFILGLQPPPLGGVSVHIKRKKDFLEKKGNKVVVWDVVKEYQKRFRLVYVVHLFFMLLRVRPTVIYYHTLFLRNNFYELILLIFYKFFFRSKLVLVEHSLRFLYKRSTIYKRILNWLIRCVDLKILIGKSMLNAYKDNGIVLGNFFVESSFIPPLLENERRIFSNYPDDLKDFIKSKKILVVMNASKFDLWDGQDIYGFDLCAKLISDFKASQIGFVIAVGTTYNQNYYSEINEQLNKDNAFLALNIKEELWPLIKSADLFLRPSRFDNYSVSVAEALYFNVPVIASDVGERPDNIILFKSGDYDDFKQKVEVWLNNYENNNHCSYSK